jgi:hypothetical protein
MQCEGLDWVQLDQDRNRSKFYSTWQWTFRVHKKHFLNSWVTFNFIMTLLLGFILNSECVWSRSKHKGHGQDMPFLHYATMTHTSSKWMTDFNIYTAWTMFEGTSPTLIQKNANYDSASWPLFVDVCSMHILSVFYVKMTKIILL